MGLSSNKASPLGPSPPLHCTAVGLERRRATPHPCVRVPRGSTVQFPQVATGGRCDSSLVLLKALPFQRWEQPSNFRARRQWHPTPILLPGKIPWTEEPGRLQSMGSLRVGHDWATSLWIFTFMLWRRKWQPTPVFLPGESHGQRSLVGCCLWGRTESDTTEAT